MVLRVNTRFLKVLAQKRRKIESRCQLELAIAFNRNAKQELETIQERRPVNDQWRAGQRFWNGLDLRSKKRGLEELEDSIRSS